MRSRFCAATALGLFVDYDGSFRASDAATLARHLSLPPAAFADRTIRHLLRDRTCAAVSRGGGAQSPAPRLRIAAGDIDATANMPTAERTPGIKPALSGKITVFTAKKIVTMDPGWPEGTAVAVMDGRILSVGTFDDLKPWLDKYPFEVDDRFKDKVDLSGLRRGAQPSGDGLIGDQPSLAQLFPSAQSLWRRHSGGADPRRCDRPPQAIRRRCQDAGRDDPHLGL